MEEEILKNDREDGKKLSQLQQMYHEDKFLFVSVFIHRTSFQNEHELSIIFFNQ